MQVDAYGQDELHEMLTRFETKSPNGNAISEPVPFNLMFETQIGPTGQNPGYMRPETAQGMFVNFQRCLNYNNGRVPFGVAQMGRAYRNEISPRSGLLRFVFWVVWCVCVCVVFFFCLFVTRGCRVRVWCGYVCCARVRACDVGRTPARHAWRRCVNIVDFSACGWLCHRPS